MKREQMVEQLKELGFEYGSIYRYGIDMCEVWYNHPSGAAINIDDTRDHNPAYLQRKLDIAPHKIRIHEFCQLAEAKAIAYAEAKGRYADRQYYLCNCDGEQDWVWRINTKQFGTTLEYLRGKELLPEEYDKVADSFLEFKPK